MIYYLEFWRFRYLLTVPGSKNLHNTGIPKLRSYKRWSPAPSSVKISCCRITSVVWVDLVGGFLSQDFQHTTHQDITRSIPLILLNRHLAVYHLLLCARLFSSSALSPLLTQSNPTAEQWSCGQRGVSSVGQIASEALRGHDWPELLQATALTSKKQQAKQLLQYSQLPKYCTCLNNKLIPLEDFFH